MSAADYTHGEMEIEDQEHTWSAFKTFSLWGSLITILVIAYPLFTLALGMHWVVALVLLAGSAIVGGLILGMGGRWVAAVIGLSALAVFIQIIIEIVKLLL